VDAVDGGTFELLLIPHMLEVTTWGERNAGDTVNIEVDQMAHYAARLMEAGREGVEATAQPIRART
jgi:riboflavin synthase